MKLYMAVAIGLVAGLLLGLIAALTQSPLLLGLAQGIEPIGTVGSDAMDDAAEALASSMTSPDDDVFLDAT